MTKKLEALFNLPEQSTEEITVADAQHVIDENQAIINQVNGAIDKIDAALPLVRDLEAGDNELDELATMATKSYQDLIDLGMNVDARFSGTILQTAGTGGINSISTNGEINLLSQGSDINIGVTPEGTPSNLQTNNLNLESLNNFNVNSGDMYFVSTDVISFVSTTGDIQFGNSSNGAPVIKFENGNILVNQTSSQLDYQLDVAVSHPSDSKNGYNGIVVNTIVSNVAADLTLQTSNALGDGTQCILSMGSFGSNNNNAIFQNYLAYQIGNMVIRLDGPYYSPNAS